MGPALGGRVVSKADKAARAAGRGPGPIAAWRFTLSIASSALLTGQALVEATTTGQHMDLALGRSFGAAFVVWIASGRVNRVFADADRRANAAETDVESPASGLDTATSDLSDSTRVLRH